MWLCWFALIFVKHIDDQQVVDNQKNSCFDENGKEWRVDVSPAETKLYPIEIRVDDYMDYGVMAMIAKEALPGSHTFTLRILLATDDDNDDVYNFETVNQITITINVIGEIQGESEENTEDPLLPGPSFLSVILAMCALVYRRRKV